MTITFRIRFHTHTGQSLWLAGSHPLPAHPIPMKYMDSECWEVTIPLAATAVGETLNYAYALIRTDGSRATDWGRDRSFVPADCQCSELLVVDSWNYAGYVQNVFYTEPFKTVLFAEHFTPVKTAVPGNPTHTFRVKAPQLKKGQTICLLGDGAALGQWNTQNPALLGRQQKDDYFSVSLDLRGQAFPLAYKFGVFDVEKKFLGAVCRGRCRTVLCLHDQITPQRRTRWSTTALRGCRWSTGAARAWRCQSSVCAAKEEFWRG